MRVVFINRFYWPDSQATAQLLTDLAGALPAKDCEVVVITGRPDGVLPPALPGAANVRVRRVHSTHLGKHNLLVHGLDHLTYTVGALWVLMLTLRRGDLLVVMTDPPLFHVLAWPIAKLRRSRLINWVQDIYPEVAVLLTGRRAFGWLRPLRDWAWRHSAACVTLGRDMGELILAAGVAPSQLHLVPNWAPEGLVALDHAAAARLRAEWDLTGRFVVGYFGNLGRVHDLDAIVELAAATQAEPDIVFMIVGAGAQRARLEQGVRQRQLRNVHFHPSQPRERRSEILALADVHLVTLRPGCERVVFPSKLYGICAAARPVFFVGPPDSEIADLIRGCGLGLVHSRAGLDAAAAALQRLRQDPAAAAAFGRAGRTFYLTRGCLGPAVARWREILVATSHPAGHPSPSEQSPRDISLLAS